MRVFAIGDIHGCLVALEALVDAIAPGPADRLVFLGDYVDRGPSSCEVISLVMRLRQRCQVIPIRGNHEEMMLGSHKGLMDPRMWLACGGDATLQSYAAQTGVARAHEAHLKFIEFECYDFFEDDTHLFVHAHAHAELPLSEQSVETLRWARFGDPLPHKSGKVLVTGHTAQKDGRPRNLGHAVCVDTYCYGGGSLTALETKSGRVLQARPDGTLSEGHIDNFRIAAR